MPDNRLRTRFKGKFIELLPDTCHAEARGKRDPYKEEKKTKEGEVEMLRRFFENTIDAMLDEEDIDLEAAWNESFARGERP